jgi:hypothetical protein
MLRVPLTPMRPLAVWIEYPPDEKCFEIAERIDRYRKAASVMAVTRVTCLSGDRGGSSAFRANHSCFDFCTNAANALARSAVVRLGFSISQTARCFSSSRILNQ